MINANEFDFLRFSAFFGIFLLSSEGNKKNAEMPIFFLFFFVFFNVIVFLYHKSFECCNFHFFDFFFYKKVSGLKNGHFKNVQF